MGKSSVAFFKPYQNKGTAMIMEYSPPGKNKAGTPTKGGMFLTMMPELENRKFNSKAKLVVSIGVTDFGELVAVLTGRKNGLGQFKDGKWTGIYHEVKGKHSSSISLSVKDDGNGYYMSLGRKVGNDVVRHNITLNLGEACTLLEFLRYNAGMFFQDKFNKQSQPTTGNTGNVPAADIPF